MGNYPYTFVYAPSLLAGYIGGWTALKFAASWDGESSDPYIKKKRLVFLSGSTFSMGLAVFFGYLVSPENLAYWAPD